MSDTLRHVYMARAAMCVRGARTETTMAVRLCIIVLRMGKWLFKIIIIIVRRSASVAVCFDWFLNAWVDNVVVLSFCSMYVIYSSAATYTAPPSLYRAQIIMIEIIQYLWCVQCQDNSGGIVPVSSISLKEFRILFSAFFLWPSVVMLVWARIEARIYLKSDREIFQ